MVRDLTGGPEADGPWDSRRPIRYTPTVTGQPSPLAEDRPGFEFDGPFPLAHRRPAARALPPPRNADTSPSASPSPPPRRPGSGTPSPRSRASSHAEWTRLLGAHRAEPRETAGQRFRANLHFRGWGMRVALPIASMTAVGVAVVVIAGANSGAGTAAPPSTATTLGYPPATLAGRDFAAASSSRGVTLQLGRMAADGPEVVAVGAETGTLVPRAEFFISHNGGTTWSLAPESGPDGGAPPPGHAPSLIAGGAGGWVAVGTDSIWTSANGASWTLRSTAGLPGATVLRRTASGFIAAGGDEVYLSATGATWRRVPGPPGALTLRYAAASGGQIVLAGAVPGGAPGNGGTGGMSGAWLSTDGGRTWMPVPVPRGHGASGQISGVAAIPGGFVLVRPSRSGGKPAAAVYRSVDGAAWTYTATLRGVTPEQLNGGPAGAILAAAGPAGGTTAFTSPDGVAWQRVALDGAAITGTAPAPGGAVLTTAGADGPRLEAIGADGSVMATRMAAVPGALQPQLAVTAVAAHDSEQVAVGSANGFPAVWTSTDGGTDWDRAFGSRQSVFRRPGSQQLTSVAYGPRGWLAVGGVTGGAVQHPIVVGSVDGRVWTTVDSEPPFITEGLVITQVAAGPSGYVIVGYQQHPGGGTSAAAWWSAGLAGWRRIPSGILDAADGVTGDRQMLAVASLASTPSATATATPSATGIATPSGAGSPGFVAVGRQGGSPAVWLSRDGQNWTVSALRLPPAAARAVLLHVAAANGTVVATGMIQTPQGALAPFAARSADGGVTWTQSMLPVPRGTATVTALAGAPGNFTATGSYGTTPGNQSVVIWTSADGTTWTAATPGGVGMSGPGISAITALTVSGTTLTGVGFTATPATQSPLFWQAPLRP